MFAERPDAAFVGRTRELATVESHLAGPGGLLLITGAAGMGKTTLVERALRCLDGIPVVRGYCPSESAPPLWPWRAPLRRARIEIQGALDVEAAAAPSARFAALAQMSDALTHGEPSVIFLEDLHWADHASLDLLGHVVAAGRPGVILIGTVRSPAADNIDVQLAGLGRYGARTLPLGPFTRDDVATLVGAESSAEILNRTGGLPLLVAATGDDDRSTDLATVVRRLLAGINADQRSVIEAASVLGEHVDDTLLGQVTGGAVDAALTAAWRGGLLVLAEDGRSFRFGHALIRDEIARRIDPATRRQICQSAARALESSADGDRAGQVASLWRQAGTDADSRLAASHWARHAAARARATHAYDDAVSYLTEALDDASSVASADVRAQILLELAVAEYLAGHYDRCLERSLDAADTAEPLGLGDIVALSALVLQGVTYPQAGHVLSRLCRRALTFDLPAALRARVLAQSATIDADGGRVDQADPLARKAVALAASSGDAQAQIEAARAREMTLVHAGDNGERLSLGDLVADRAETLGQPVAAIIGHSWRIRSAYELGRLDIVESATGAVADLASRAGLPLANWHLYRLLSSRSALVGQFAESIDYSRRATAIAAVSGDQTAFAMFFAHGIHLADVRGDPDDLPTGYQQALAAAPSMPLIDIQRAHALVLTGRDNEAYAIYARLASSLPIPELHPAWPAVLTQMVALIARFNDAKAAELAYRQLMPFRPQPGAFGSPTVYFTGSMSRYLGELAMVIGDKTLATELLREALDRNRVLGAWPDIALASLDLARVLREQSPTSRLEADAIAQDAFSIATRVGMPGTVAAAAELMTPLAANRSRADSLTAREREVAVLVAQAMTNRQIAEHLVLSERTIESHVRSLLAKTHCANRTEFVARWSGSHQQR
jgi:DNA-binding CsgD family transcriptional regulator